MRVVSKGPVIALCTADWISRYFKNIFQTPAACTGRHRKEYMDFGFVYPLAIVQLLVFSAAFQMMFLYLINPRISL